MKPALLPSQRAIIAMSREQYLKSSIAPLTTATTTTSGAASSINELSVGVCVFRLDGQTSQPVVLLLRRSKGWQQRNERVGERGRVFSAADESSSSSWPSSSSSSQRHLKTQQGTEGSVWELPGGEVGDDDFCISAAAERLLRENTGLRITKMMVMLPDVRWREELKVLLWEDEDESDEDEGNEDGDGGDRWDIREDCAVEKDNQNNGGCGHEDEAEKAGEDKHHEFSVDLDSTQLRPRADSGVVMNWITYIQNGGLESASTRYDDDGSSGPDGGVLSPFSSHELELLGVRVPTNPSSPGSSSLMAWAMPTPTSTQSPRAHDQSQSRSRSQSHENNVYSYGDDDDFDLSLEPAPLSLPIRNRKGKEEERRSRPPLRRRNTASSTTLPREELLMEEKKKRKRKERENKRRDAQMIPYEMVQREHVQLNFVVLVDEDEDVEVPLPGFLMPRRTWDRDVKGREGEEGKYDGFEWATRERVREMGMSEDLRRVVFQGLDWMDSLAGGFF